MRPLSIIFNKSFEESHFPSCMKRAEVVPLYKGKEHTLKTNYRPISLLLTLSKLLEKAMYQRTYDFLDSTNQFYDGQFGFRSKHSCEHAVENLVSDIVKSSANGIATTAVYIDLSKAFDTLSHPILLTKLSRYGVRGQCLKWYESYLHNRKIQVKCCTGPCDSVLSDQFDIEFGAPQGSCLGPLLFSIFTNDIHKNLMYVKCILFADDTTLYLSHRNLNYLSWCIEQDLQILSDWFRANLLTLNEQKSVSMTFKLNSTTGGNRIKGCNIKVNGIALLDVTHARFLRIWIDSRLTWGNYLNKLLLQLKRNIHMLRTGRHSLSIHAKKVIYYSHVYSHLMYGLILWGNMLKQSDLVKLQKIQNKCLKLITGEEASPTNYHKHKMLRINEIIKFTNGKHSHRVQHSHLPTRILECSHFDERNNSLEKKHDNNTRHKSSLNLPSSTNSLYRRSFLYRSTSDYQSIPMSVKNIENELLFTKAYKKFLLTGVW